LSAVLFGLIHAGNPNATWWAALGLALQAGVLLGAAYLACRSLWLPIGIHWGWNAIQAGVVGGTVSGHTTKSVWTLEPAGPEVLSGGAFGLEGSIVATTLCAALAVVFCVIAVRSGRILPGFWAHGESESRGEQPVAAAEV
jgi:membrane protease YdiL (CAAX protease family)